MTSFGVALDFGSSLRSVAAQLERQAGILQYAEDAGFSMVAAGEVLAPTAFHLPNALEVLAAVALRTRVRLCTGIALLPAWDVEKLALDAAELDQLSGGRLTLGIGLGSAALRRSAGWPENHAGQTVDDYLAKLRSLWTDGSLAISPVQPGGPPIWVGGSIRRSARRAARLGQGWYAGINFRLSRLPVNVGWYHDALRSENTPVEHGQVVINRLVLAAESDSELAELSELYLAETLKAYAAGQDLASVTADVALVGTPEQIVAQAERYRAAGVTHIFCRLSLDAMPEDVVRRTITLLGREVIPHVT